MTLVDLSQVEVTVAAPERYVNAVDQRRREGLPVTVQFDALGEEFTGIIKAIIPRAIPQARTFPVVVAVPNPNGRIRAGMTARVLAQVGSPVPAVLVPKDALVLRAGRTFVFRVVPLQAPVGDAAAPGGAGSAADAGDGGAAAGGAAAPHGVQELEVEIGAGYGDWQVVRGGVQAGDQV
ncbi:MAG: efflux RND transporter periplasmic adaptor subunit, partial [Halomonas sp.]|nr:efflux RND transporter periplasmic adaptor subunit [Halomonas sp.]